MSDKDSKKPVEAWQRYRRLSIWVAGIILCWWPTAFAKSAKDKVIYRIGFIHPRSGPLAPFGNSLAQGVKMGLQQFRLENPKMGEQIGLISADDRGLASEGEKAALRLIQQQKVHLLIGSLSNTVNQSIAAVCNQNATVLLLPWGSDENLLGNPHVFTMSLTDRRQGQLLATFVSKVLRRDKAVIITDSQSPDAELIGKGFADTFTQAGSQVIGQWNWGSPELPAAQVLSKMAEAQANVVIYPGSYRTVAPLLAGARKSGIKTTFVGSDGWDHENLYSMGADTLGSQYYFSYFHSGDPQAGVQSFIADYTEAFGQKPDALAALGYDTVRAALQTFVLSNSSQTPQLLKSLEGAHFPGIYGAGRFAKDHVYLRPYPLLITTGGQPRFMARVLLEE